MSILSTLFGTMLGVLYGASLGPSDESKVRSKIEEWIDVSKVVATDAKYILIEVIDSIEGIEYEDVKGNTEIIIKVLKEKIRELDKEIKENNDD